MTLTRTISSEEPEPKCEDSGFERERGRVGGSKGLFKASLSKEGQRNGATA